MLSSDFDTIVNASHAYPFDLLPNHSIVFSASSIGVPVNLFIYLVHPETSIPFTESQPNEVDAFLFRSVLEDLVDKGIGQIRNETIYKFEIIHQVILENPSLEPAVTSKNNQSKTVIGFFYNGGQDIFKILGDDGYHLDVPKNGEPIIINNFATHSKEQFEQLSDKLARLK